LKAQEHAKIQQTPKTAKLGMKQTWSHGDFAASMALVSSWCAFRRFGAFTGLTTEPRLTYVCNTVVSFTIFIFIFTLLPDFISPLDALHWLSHGLVMVGHG
jgi:hypothetical protein